MQHKNFKFSVFTLQCCKVQHSEEALLEKLQNLIDKAFGSAEINHRSISDDENQNKCPHEIGY